MIKTVQRQLSNAGKQVRQTFLGIVARSAARTLQLKGLDGEVLQEVELIQQVGFASWIPEGSKVVILPVGGKTGRAVVVGSTAAPVMIEVSQGQTAIWDQFGHQILLHESGIKIIGDVEVQGSVTASGDISDKKSSMQAMRGIYNGHKHGNTPTPVDQM